MVGLKAKLLARMDQFVLQGKNSLANLQPCPQLCGIDRLREVIIGSSLQSPDHVLCVVFSGNQQNVRVNSVSPFTNSATEFRTVDTRHYPIQNEEIWSVAL